jgi:hypothetical protein
VVNAVLERALEVREGLGRAAELHALANIVAALLAELTLLTGQADLERDAVADLECGNGGTDGRHHASRLVAKRHGLSHNDVAVPIMAKVVQV